MAPVETGQDCRRAEVLSRGITHRTGAKRESRGGGCIPYRTGAGRPTRESGGTNAKKRTSTPTRPRKIWIPNQGARVVKGGSRFG